MADDKTTFSLDLDSSDFLKGLADAKGGLLGLADAGNLKSLIEGFDSILPILGTLTVAFLAVKETLGLVFAGEEIRAINTQFDILTANAGLSSEAIKSGMEKASGGLIDTNTLLKMSNEAIIRLGGSAKQLPEIMEMARKASVVMGTDLQTTFNNLTLAIQTGNQRLLKRAGLNIDAAKAEEKYAASIGVSVSALSAQGKTQAIMNAALEEAKTKYAGIDPDIKEATNTWEKLKTTLVELKDTAVLVFEKTVGPKVREMLSLTAQWAKNVQMYFQNSGKDVDYYRDKLKALREEQGKQRAPGAATSTTAEASVDYTKQREQAAKFQKELTTLQTQGSKDREAIVKTEADVDAAMQERQLLLTKQYQSEIEQLETNHALTRQQKKQALAQLEKNHQAQLTALTLNAENERQTLLQRSLDNQAKASDTFFGKFAAGAKKASQQASKDFSDFSKLGSDSVNKLANATSQAFAQMGQGTADLATAMKQAILNAMADEAESRGALLIAESIWPPNPLGLAAGAGLSALAGVLRGAAGGGSSSSISTPSSAAGGGTVGTDQIVSSVASAGTDTSGSATATPKQQVTINIAGSYFDTAQTASRLTDLIRQSADAADFKIQSIGGGL